MKKILLIIALTLFSSVSYAECSINFTGTIEIQDILSKTGVTKNNGDLYQNLCKNLNKNNAALFFTGFTKITPSQTTAFVEVSLIDKNLINNMRTQAATGSVWVSPETSTTKENDLLYKAAMDLVEDLAKNQHTLQKMLEELNKFQKLIKNPTSMKK